MAAVDRDVVLASESGNGKIDLRHAIRPRLGFTVLTVERASRSLWASLAGLSCHASGTRPSLIACFSSLVLRCLGAATLVASTICPPIAR